MGLDLKSPLVVSSSPLSRSLDNICRIEDHGAGALVMFSLFEEQILSELSEVENLVESTASITPETSEYFPQSNDYYVTVDRYLELIRTASERVDMPIIGSLNGVTSQGWIEYAELIEEAGAAAIEINIYHFPMNLDITGNEIEQLHLDIVASIREQINIPIAVKLNPYFSAFANIVKQFESYGANGLVLFNRLYQPDFDIETLDVTYDLELSNPHEIRLPLLWISSLFGNVNLSLAATTGIQSSNELIKYLLAGANVGMTASSLLKHGIEYLDTIHNGLINWMESRGFSSVDELRGTMSRDQLKDNPSFGRGSYIKMLTGYDSTY